MSQIQSSQVGAKNMQTAQPQAQQRPINGSVTLSNGQRINPQNLTPQQQRLLQQKVLHQKLKNYKFAETSEEILHKYEKFPPSLTFHIHENHYRFGDQDGVIPKNSSVIKAFLEYVAREEIPPALIEVTKDAGVQLYEGCIILRIYDHRHLVAHINDAKDSQHVSSESSANNTNNEKKEPSKVPKTYTTILRPTQLSLYADLLYQTDYLQVRFTDSLSLNIETEILTASKRNLDLSVPLNPHRATANLKPEVKYPYYDPETDTVVHEHRPDARGNMVNADTVDYRKLHEDMAQHGSDYERLMLLLSDRFDDDSQTQGSSVTSSQFMRLRFVEAWRKKEERLQESGGSSQRQRPLQPGQIPGMLSSFSSNTGNMNTMLDNLTPQQKAAIQQRMIQQGRAQPQQQQPDQEQLQEQQQQQPQQAMSQQRQQQLQQLYQRQQQHNQHHQQNQDELSSLDDKKIKKPPAKKQKKMTKKEMTTLHQNVAGKTIPSAESTPPTTAANKKRGTYKKKNSTS
ncbi:GQ67_01519T0 [Komagataella phaffii]|nr:GQ67_01519T0 [Komagataella phaffii]AOA65929.1 GQ68_01535T0 [Komagataella phaffii GS115]